MLLPVWIQTWQLDCCGPDVSVGEKWSTALIVDEVQGLRAAPSAEVGWKLADHGVITFVAQARPVGTDDEPPSLLDLGHCRIGATTLVAAGAVSGRAQVFADWHGAWDFPDVVTDYDDITVAGVVAKILRMPIVDVITWPHAHRDPVPVESTADRESDDDLLIDLEVRLQRPSGIAL